MAIAVKDTVSGTIAAGSSSSISMPSNSAGDVVVAWFGQDYNASDSIATLSGFTTITDSNLSSRPIARSAYAVNPGATATLTSGSTTGRDLAYILRSYSGVDTTSPLTGSSSRASSATGTPNPPSITPAVNGAMVVALGVIENESDTTYSAPSGYSNLRVQSALEGAATNVVLMMADFLQTTAAAENPAAFTHASASNENSGITLALKPNASTNGTLSKTEAADTVSATGKRTTNGTLSKTEAADTLAATAQRTTHGTLSKTEAADTVAGTAQRTTHAAAGITEAADTSTATGQRTTHATAAITEAADTASGQAILLPLPSASPTAEDGGYGEHLGRQIDRRRDAAREHDLELDRAIEWAINPPVDEAAIAAAEEQAMRQSYAAERLMQSLARRRDDDDALAVLLMVI